MPRKKSTEYGDLNTSDRRMQHRFNKEDVRLSRSCDDHLADLVSAYGSPPVRDVFVPHIVTHFIPRQIEVGYSSPAAVCAELGGTM